MQGIKNKTPGTRYCSYVLILISLFMCISGEVYGLDYTGHISITSGGLATDNEFSNAFNIDKKYELGLSFDVKKKNWPVSIAFDSSFLHAESEISVNQYNPDENKKISFFRSDACLGVKKIINVNSNIKPFIGSGIYFVRIYGKMLDEREIVAGLGYWLGAGVYFDLSKDLTCGVLWKLSKADLKIFDVQSDVGGHHFNLITGFHF